MKYVVSILFSLYSAFDCIAQQQLTPEILEQAAFRFSLNAENQLEGEAREKWLNWIEHNQFVGLAEVHNSGQLSFFTKALINVLHEKGFDHFAIEMGPNSVSILEEAIIPPENPLESIRLLNRKYGKKSTSKTPLIFVNKLEDAAFVEEASKLGFQFWGLDQEFAGSYEMLLDRIYEIEKNEALTLSYQKAKAAIRKAIFKNKVEGQPVYCWYSSSEVLNNFFEQIKKPASLKIIKDIRTSWDIYCKSATGQGSNQQRADHMKQNFENYLEENGADTKVLVKLGGIHLTHGLSRFGVDDVGKYLTEKAVENNTSFLSIRHLITYRNGKSNVGKAGWKNTQLFLKLGRKDQWTVLDLRPFKKRLNRGEITASKSIEFEIMNYDLLLISPDDQYPKVNY